ncbi:single-stranded DNA-binding protein [Microbacterium sp. LWO13-1.2]|uniref:single-stranded DNA-binding protein n=1 Tax=Microbacterium sp. LWO13-1.2 TaxID=3135262 RepID=UPI003138BC09
MTDTLTIVGNVATDPVLGRTPSGIPVTNFRVASSQRRFDNATQQWVETSTNWYSIAAFRQLAEHAKASLRSGDSVIVTGRLKIRNWEANGKHGTSVDIDADTIGHDLRWGTAAYARAARSTPVENREPIGVDAADGPEEAATDVDPDEAMALSAAVWTAPDAAPELADADTTPF